MKRIVFIVDSLGQGGSERQILMIANNLIECGYAVLLIDYYEGVFYEQYQKMKNSVPIFNACSNNKLKKILLIREKLREFCPDTIVSLLINPAAYAMIASMGMKANRIITWRFADEGLFWGRKRKLVNYISNYANTIVFNSENGKNIWLRNRPSDKEKAVVIMNLMDLNVINAAKPLEYVMRAGYKVHIVVAARISEVKNADGLIKALLLLNEKERSQIAITWYGQHSDSKGYFQRVQRMIQENYLEDVIKFEPPVTNIEKVMRQADIIGLFSHKEGFPNAICEGLLSGKPIIMTPVSDYSALVNGGNGFLCASDTPEDIADMLKRIVATSDEKLLQLGRASELMGSKLFDNEKTIEKWREVVEREC